MKPKINLFHIGMFALIFKGVVDIIGFLRSGKR